MFHNFSVIVNCHANFGVTMHNFLNYKPAVGNNNTKRFYWLSMIVAKALLCLRYFSYDGC